MFFSYLQKHVMINCFPVDRASIPSPLQSVLKKADGDTSPLAKWQETAHTRDTLLCFLLAKKSTSFFVSSA